MANSNSSSKPFKAGSQDAITTTTPHHHQNTMAGFSPGGAVPVGYSYLNRSPSLVTSTRRGPTRSPNLPSKEVVPPKHPSPSPAPNDGDRPRFPTSWSQGDLKDSLSSLSPSGTAASTAPAPQLSRSKTVPTRPSHRQTASVATGVRIQDPLASRSLSSLPRDPRNWLPSEVSIYLCHMFTNVPLPVKETLSHFVSSTHLTGKAFLRLRESDLEQRGMNRRWRKLLCEASKRLRRDALRRRIWSAKEDQWMSGCGSGSEEGSLERLYRRSIEEGGGEGEEGEGQLTPAQRRIMTVTLKRIQNRNYVKGVIEGFETAPAPSESTYHQQQQQQLQESPRRRATTLWNPNPSGDRANISPVREPVSPPFGAGYVRERVSSLSAQSGINEPVEPYKGSKHRPAGFRRGKNSIDDNGGGEAKESPSAQGDSDNSLDDDCNLDAPREASRKDPRGHPSSSYEEGSSSIDDEPEGLDSFDPWTPLEEGLIDAILHSDPDLSLSVDNQLLPPKSANQQPSRTGGPPGPDEIDYDPVKPKRVSPFDFAISAGEVPSSEPVDSPRKVAPGESPAQGGSSGEEDPSVSTLAVTAPTATVGRKAPSLSFSHARTLSKASTRSNRSFLNALDSSIAASALTSSSSKVQDEDQTRKCDSVDMSTGRHRSKSGVSISSLFQPGSVLPELEVEGPSSSSSSSSAFNDKEQGETETETEKKTPVAGSDNNAVSEGVVVSDVVQEVLLKRAELLLSPMLDVVSCAEGEEQAGRFSSFPTTSTSDHEEDRSDKEEPESSTEESQKEARRGEMPIRTRDQEEENHEENLASFVSSSEGEVGDAAKMEEHSIDESPEKIVDVDEEEDEGSSSLASPPSSSSLFGPKANVTGAGADGSHHEEKSSESNSRSRSARSTPSTADTSKPSPPTSSSSSSSPLPWPLLPTTLTKTLTSITEQVEDLKTSLGLSPLPSYLVALVATVAVLGASEVVRGAMGRR